MKTQIVSLSQYKNQKAEKELLSRGRRPLYVSHARGQISGSGNSEGLSDFGSRISEMKEQLKEINHFMKEIQQLPA